MFWPNNPQDAKNLCLTFIGGAAIAGLVLFTQFLYNIINDGWKVGSIVHLLMVIILFWLFSYFLNEYTSIRDNLDKIESMVKKNKK